MAGEWIRDFWASLVGGEVGEPIPVMDGALSPNTLLDEARPLGPAVEGAEDFAIDSAGGVFVTAGDALLRLEDGAPRRWTTVATLPGRAGPVASTVDGFAVAVAGHGVCLVSKDADVRMVEAPLPCPTAIAVAPDGSLLIANGSEQNTPDRWAFDLMRHGASGSLLSLDPRTGRTETLRRGLAWPHGVMVRPADGAVLFSESWRHRVEPVGRRPDFDVSSLPGYPARMTLAPEGGFWLSVFSLRTQLVEFVLREDSYREEMIRTVEPALWIAPALATDGYYREPLQGGGIKKLGIQKPWAPPRSYGLVIRYDAEGEPVRSLHSRVGGHWHGIVRAEERDGRLHVLSKGRGQMLAVDLEEAAP